MPFTMVFGVYGTAGCTDRLGTTLTGVSADSSGKSVHLKSWHINDAWLYTRPADGILTLVEDQGEHGCAK
jgi:hypothetical protein